MRKKKAAQGWKALATAAGGCAKCGFLHCLTPQHALSATTLPLGCGGVNPPARYSDLAHLTEDIATCRSQCGPQERGRELGLPRDISASGHTLRGVGKTQAKLWRFPAHPSASSSTYFTLMILHEGGKQ